MIIQPQIIGGGSSSTANITFTDKMRFGYSQWAAIPDDVMSILNGYRGSLSSMFVGCSLVSADLSSITFYPTTVYGMFQSCTKLTSVAFDGIVFTGTMANMFNSASVLTSIDFTNCDTTAVNSMQLMFTGVGYTTNDFTLDLSCFNTANCEVMASMFNNAYHIKTLHLGNNWDMGKVSNAYNMFWGDADRMQLTTVTGTITNLGKAFTSNTIFDLARLPLTEASAMVFINGLYDLVSAGSSLTHTIKFSSTAYGNLSAADIAVATAKGWTVTS